MSKTYDPGRPRGVKSLGGRRYAVASFREAGTAYIADLHAGTCTCPFFVKKLLPDVLERGEAPPDCKHLHAAREHAGREGFLRGLRTGAEELRRELGREELTPEERRGLRLALWVVTEGWERLREGDPR